MNPVSTNTHQGTAASLPDDVVLSVRGVSKKFCRNLKRSMWYGVQDLTRNLLGIRPPSSSSDVPPSSDALRRDEFWALQDINFDLRRGECLGLIGRNGCGKSTLLRLLAGIFPPDAGEVAVRGRIGALIALGAGFHPHMTARENIYLNGTILGLSADELAGRFDEIVTFSEVGDFLDAPVATFSSGMTVKLGFAIAIHTKPDVLLIDEVLAVGDMGFKIKCLNAMRAMIKSCAVVFVSHSMQFVSSFCNRIIVLNRGTVSIDTNNISDGIDCYRSLFPITESTSGSGEAQIEDVALSAGTGRWEGRQEAVITPSQPLTLRFKANVNPEAPRARVSVFVMDEGFDPIICCTPEVKGLPLMVEPGAHDVRVELPPMDLNNGKYSLVIALQDVRDDKVLCRVEGVGVFRVASDRVIWGRLACRAAAAVERIAVVTAR